MDTHASGVAKNVYKLLKNNNTKNADFVICRSLVDDFGSVNNLVRLFFGFRFRYSNILVK